MNPVIIQNIREKTPLIHHLTNQVVMNFTANGLLAFGGAPIMAKSEVEAYDMAQASDGVLINIGTITEAEVKAMILAGKAANEKGIPVVLDPVGVAATAFRTDIVKQILAEVQPTAIKGNAGELAYLAHIPWKSKGVESIGDGNTKEIAQKVAEMYHTTAIVTGKIDTICNGNQIIQNETGHAFLTKVTGAGCLLGSIITACLTTNDPTLEQALTAVQFYGLAAEYAASRPDVHGSGSFLPNFIDALSLEPEDLERRA